MSNILISCNQLYPALIVFMVDENIEISIKALVSSVIYWGRACFSCYTKMACFSSLSFQVFKTAVNQLDLKLWYQVANWYWNHTSCLIIFVFCDTLIMALIGGVDYWTGTSTTTEAPCLSSLLEFTMFLDSHASTWIHSIECTQFRALEIKWSREHKLG